MRKAAEDEAKKAEASSFRLTPSVVYLLLYNTIQALGWTGLSILTVMHVSSHKSFVTLYEDVKVALNIFQTMALLEIVHAATGIVPSNVIFTTFQVMSRVYLVWGVYYTVPETQSQIGLLLILIAWCITEIVRYSYYVGALVRNIPYLLQWARYSLFIVLYPLGVTGELLSVYSGLPHVRHRRTLSLGLPNAANISFDYYYALIVIMLSYIPLFPQLYFHMISQRKKVIGGEKRRKED